MTTVHLSRLGGTVGTAVHPEVAVLGAHIIGAPSVSCSVWDP